MTLTLHDRLAAIKAIITINQYPCKTPHCHNKVSVPNDICHDCEIDNQFVVQERDADGYTDAERDAILGDYL